MKLGQNKELVNTMKQKIEDAPAEKKSEVIAEVIQEMVETLSTDLVSKYQSDAEKARNDEEFAKSIGLRTLSADEKKFYEKFKVAKQSFTGEQEDVLPVTIIDRTLADVKKQSRLLEFVNIAPAGVKKWLVGGKTGAAAWGALSAALLGELTASITSVAMDTHKLAAYLIVPKGIYDLGLAFVDRYFRAILAEAIVDGLEQGVIEGDGDDAPIGFAKLISSSTDGVHADKTPVAITDFSPASLGPIVAEMTKDGVREVSGLMLICNPADYYGKVFPASRAFVNGQWVSTFPLDIEVIQTANCSEGAPVLAMRNEYDLGMQAVRLDVYRETKALDDADVFVAKTYGNGRATDDGVAVVLDISGLTAYIPSVFIANDVIATQEQV